MLEGSSPSPDELEPSIVQPKLEKGKQKSIEPAKGPTTTSEAKTSLVINISQHPLYDKKTHPTPGVKSLEELHQATKDADGPFWFEFLSKAMDYDHGYSINTIKLSKPYNILETRGIRQYKRETLPFRNNQICKSYSIVYNLK